jgi:hypothetical protein
MTIPEVARQIQAWLEVLAAPGQVIDLRCLGYRTPHHDKAGVYAGFWDGGHHEQMAREAAEATRYARGVYWTFNPLRADCLQRSANKLTSGQRHLARDEDVLARRWLLIDVDPVRPAGVSSTEGELDAARQVTGAAADYLRGLGWPEPVRVHSGNGFHLYYRVDLPAADGGLCQQVLHALATRCDADGAKIDTAVFNPSRISKLPGTWARKGKETAARRHRRAELISAPATQLVVPTALLEALAGTVAPVARSAPTAAPGGQLVAGDRGRIAQRARAYLQNVGGAVSGQRGHDATYRAACILVQRFDLTPGEALPILQEWNARCEPPWEEAELQRKLAEADKAAGPRGEFLRYDWADNLTHIIPGGPSAAGGAPGVAAAPGGPAPARPAAALQFDPALLPWGNYREVAQGDGPPARVGVPMQLIQEHLSRLTGGWPRRVGRCLFAVRDHRAVWLRQPADLFSWVGSRLPPLAENQLRWERGRDKVTQEQFFAFLQEQAQHYEAVEEYPHWPPVPNHYYLHPELPAPGGEAIKAFLSRFHPETDADGDLLLALLLTLCWGGPAGSRPAFILTGTERDPLGGKGIGKSKVIHYASQLFGGSVDFSTSEQLSNIHARLLSPEAATKRVVLFDNVKSRRFSWGDLEALITAPTISGRQLYTGEGRRPNTILWAITLNGVNLSRDLAQRAAIVRLARPKYTGNWQRQTEHFVEANRWQIIADAIDLLKVDVEPPPTASRWGEWERAVLSKVADPVVCQRLMGERSAAADDDSEEIEVVREAFAEALLAVGADPDTTVRRFTPLEAAEITARAIGGKPSTARTLAYLYGLGIAEISREKAKYHRWIIWKGRNATEETDVTDYLS